MAYKLTSSPVPSSSFTRYVYSGACSQCYSQEHDPSYKTSVYFTVQHLYELLYSTSKMAYKMKEELLDMFPAQGNYIK